ncbi:hypothetical protein [Hyphomicrobium sp.]|uniref:hypothetical protein n=1 Tax=Hyphomicrobium sp. TaxID=82 RepID=UPI002E325674|nr:hypothetical protein [Hyphomicrobium sp.]HEX2841857.1 hypothetical protein [Hyphomicrobium sp.]
MSVLIERTSIGSVFVVAFAGAGISVGAAAQQAGAQSCLSIVENDARLACYDREVRKLVPPNFSGRLSKTTDSFHVDRPIRLRYQSDGAIFVLYLKSADGSVIQNLHLGGGGEATYRIEQPGTYFLDVNGSESWRIWLEPDATQSTN